MAGEFMASLTVSGGQVVGGLFRSILSTDLPFSGVSAGQYTLATVTVDQYGRITSIANGAGGVDIGDPVGDANDDNSLLFVDSSGNLQDAAPGTLWYSVSAGTALLPTLHIGSDAAGRGQFALWNAGSAYAYFGMNASGQFVIPVNTLIQGTLTLTPAIDAIPFRVTAHASQSNNLSEWLSPILDFYARINKNGYFLIAKVAAPADAEISGSELALWFDDTNGAGKLMIKAKTANGTVVTGSVLLA